MCAFLLSLDPPEFNTSTCTPVDGNIWCGSNLEATNGIVLCSNPTPVPMSSMTGNDLHLTIIFSIAVDSRADFVDTCITSADPFNSSITRTFQLFVGGMYVVFTVIT